MAQTRRKTRIHRFTRKVKNEHPKRVFRSLMPLIRKLKKQGSKYRSCNNYVRSKTRKSIKKIKSTQDKKSKDKN